MAQLELQDVHTAYGRSQVLFGVSFSVEPGECVALIGRNGVGKTTTIRSIAGLVAPRRGAIEWLGENIAGRPSHRVAKLGIGYVPEERRIFPELTVWENLDIARRETPGGWDEERVFGLFPDLRPIQASPRRGALRRTAADADHRPEPDGQPAAAAPRRAVGGPRAEGRRVAARPGAEPEGRGPVDRPRGAEPLVRAFPERPLPHHGEGRDQALRLDEHPEILERYLRIGFAMHVPGRAPKRSRGGDEASKELPHRHRDRRRRGRCTSPVALAKRCAPSMPSPRADVAGDRGGDEASKELREHPEILERYLTV